MGAEFSIKAKRPGDARSWERIIPDYAYYEEEPVNLLDIALEGLMMNPGASEIRLNYVGSTQGHYYFAETLMAQIKVCSKYIQKEEK